MDRQELAGDDPNRRVAVVVSEANALAGTISGPEDCEHRSVAGLVGGVVHELAPPHV
jgi:hypothetical protein